MINNKSNMKRIIIILAGIVMSANCFAQQEQDTVITGTLNDATQTDSIYYGEFAPYNDVFYKFTPNENMTISVNLNYQGDEKDVFLFKYSNPTNELASSYDSISVPKTIIYKCQADTTYLIRVIDYEGLGGDFTLSLKDVTPFKITTDTIGSGSVVSNGDTLIRNSECTVFAVPASCYRFVKWTDKNGVFVSDDIEYTFLVDSNRKLVANFELREYEIYSSAENGIIDTTQKIICGGSKTVTFFPIDNCHQFDGLWVDGDSAVAVGDTAYTFSNVTEGYTIFASFKKKEYSLAAASSVFGYITPADTTVVFCGDTLTYTFVPETLPNKECELHYIVVDGDTIWAGDTRIINNSYTFEDITDTHKIYAAFKRITFNILANADAHSTITPNGNNEIIKGDNGNFIIDVTDPCYEIDSVFIDDIYDLKATNIVKYNEEYTFYSVTANHSIRISTKQKERNLTVFCGLNGKIQLNSNIITNGSDISYFCGGGSYLEFMPDSIFEILQVLLDNIDITHLIANNKLNLSSIVGKWLSVTFKESPLKFEFFAVGKGKIVSDNCDACPTLVVAYDTTLQICFLPESNNYKVAFIIDNNDTIKASQLTNNCYTFKHITVNHKIIAYFVQSKTYFITASAGANGQIDPSGDSIPVEEGEKIEFCFQPEKNYVVDYVRIDTTTFYTNDSCYTIENVISNHTIYVSFKQNTIGIADIEPSFIKIHPNPVDNLLIIESSELKIGGKMDIFDMSGKLVLSLTINETNTVSVNVGGLSQGTYLFKIGHIQGKFVKK